MPPVFRHVRSVVTLPPKAKIKPVPYPPAKPQTPVDPVRRTVMPLPQGTAGTALTVGQMRKMILQGSKSSEIREVAANLAMHHDTDQGRIGAIFDFVKTKMKYVRDPLHQEMVAGADYHMGTMAGLGYARGDCDDHTVLLGAMLESVGYPTRITTARMKPGPGTDDHVYLEVNDRRNWIPLDASNKKRGAGEEPPAQRIRRW
jgi:transglutaminase-like putative cysteine protease